MNNRFYGVNINTPLSLAHGTYQWSQSVIGRLATQTNNQIFIREIPYHASTAEYAWRVVDAFFSHEDVTMTYFRAYGLEGEPLPQAIFGVNYSTVPHTISGGFKFPPEFWPHYYVPSQACIHTPNSGGYTVQVFDLDYPSEGLTFGLFKQGQQHQALIVSFRLFKLEPGYPNDLVLPIR